jgi:hypothetical protein
MEYDSTGYSIPLNADEAEMRRIILSELYLTGVIKKKKFKKAMKRIEISENPLLLKTVGEPQ